MALDVDLALGITLLVLVAIGALVAWLTQVESPVSVVGAAARATVQLGLVSLIIAGVVKSAGWTAAFLAAMFCVAVLTSARRVTRTRAGAWTALPIAAGVVPVVGGLVVSGVLPTDGLTLIPIAGILLGAGMVATSLAGRRTLDELGAHYGIVEAGLALGFLTRDSRMRVCRPVAGE